MKLLTIFYLVLITILLGFNKIITTLNTINSINKAWTYYSYLLSIIFILCFYILQSLHNYIYFYITIGITYVISIMFILLYGNLPNNNLTYKFLIGLLVTVSMLSYTSIVKSIYHLYYTNYNDSTKGEVGYIGTQGKKGDNANILIDDNSLCVQQMINQANKQIEKHNLSNNIENIDDKFNNIYMKNKFKKICNHYIK
jgi:hypothetical protein